MREAVAGSDVALMICTETYKSKVSLGSSTNVGYELEWIMNKYALTQSTDMPCRIFPLRFSGSFEEAVPEQLRDILVRDCTYHSGYHQQLFGLSNPLGIVPAMLGLEANEDYVKAVWPAVLSCQRKMSGVAFFAVSRN
jgi:hypothetical protein